MCLKKISLLLLPILFLSACAKDKIILKDGIDETAGELIAYIIKTSNATYYLEKEGGGLSSMIDKDGVDWIGFNNEKGSGHKGEYRGFPNAIHRQDGSYFHAMNAKTDSSKSVVNIESNQHVQITFTSGNGKWEGQWDFYLDRCDFTMTKISKGYKYWIQYEGVPYGEMDASDFWFASVDSEKHPINESFNGDLPAPEWMAFGDLNAPRMLFILHHEDDSIPDNYVFRPDMTVLGFGRENKEKANKYLTTVQTFSIGFIESNQYEWVENTIKKILN